MDLASLHESLKLPVMWYDHTSTDVDSIQVCKIVSGLNGPLLVTHSISVDSDRKWKVFVHGHEVIKCSALSHIPLQLDKSSFAELLQLVNILNVCAGQPDSSFVVFADSRKGKFIGKDGSTVAFVDRYAPVNVNGETFSQTIRTSDCELLVRGQKCKSCTSYRRTLRTLYTRWSKRNSGDVSSSSSHTNVRYLNTPEKLAKITCLRKRVKTAEAEIVRLKQKVLELIQEKGEDVDGGLHQDLSLIMQENTSDVHAAFPEGTFRRIFWDQQLENSKKSNSRQYRWHPVMIKWCLNLKLISSAAYYALGNSGFVTLPSERTLRDYTNYIKSVPGYQQEVIDMMRHESKCSELPESRRYVSILLDEMKVKEDIVYDKFSGDIIGFCNLGQINDDLMKAERDADVHPPVAKQILAIMVRGIFFKFDFPLAHFN